MKKLSFLLSLALLFASVTFSQQTNAENLGFNPPSIHWKKINAPSGKIIYPTGLDSLAFRIAGIMSYQRSHDKTIVGTGKTKKVPLVIQNITIFPEGFSTPAPWRNEYYIMPPQNLFQGPTQWTDLLAIHEYRHTQQFHMAKGGFTWVFKPLMGQTGWLLNSLFNEPLWFREGDAVATETLLTKGGRGRLPRFNAETRAMLLSGYKYDYEKGNYGISLKDFVPNPYRPGFYMTTKLRRDFGDTIWQKILHDTYHKGLIYSFNHALKKNTGLSAKELYNRTMHELDSFWQKEDAQLSITPSHSLTQTHRDNYTNYRFPHFLSDGSFVCLKDAFDQVKTFTVVDSSGKEKKLFSYGIYTEDHLMFAAEGNLITWAEAAFDPRWGNKTYSIIKAHNLLTGQTKKLSAKSRYFAPAPSHDGKKIAAVHVDLLNRSSLVILDSKSGALLNEWPMPSNLVIAQPRWFDADDAVSAIGITTGGNSIISINASTGKIETIVSETTATVSRPFPKGQHIYFCGGFTSIDNIYAVDISSKKLYQVSSVRFGAYEPALSLDGKKLVFSNYTADGYQLQEMDVRPESWKEISPTHTVLATQPYVSSTPKEDITELPFKQTYTPTKYHALTSGLFHVYGWFPYIGVDQYGLQFSVQNIMNTLRGSVTPFYNTNETALGVKVDLTYAALYPMMHVGLGYQTRRAADIFDVNTPLLYKQSWKEKYYSAGLIFPFNLTQGNYRTQLTIGGDYGHYDIDFLDSLDASRKFRNVQFNSYTAQLSFSRVIQRARRHVQPRWGQTASMIYQQAIDNTPKQITAQSRFYFPGFIRSHSFNLQGRYKQEEVINTYRFPNNFVMPRGYDYEPFEKIYVASANYELPLWYPDISLGGLAFFQQLRASFFYDHSVGNRLNNEYNLHSAGFELMTDLRLLRLFGMSMGIRYSKGLNKNLLNTTPFQFVVTRFELQN